MDTPQAVPWVAAPPVLPRAVPWVVASPAEPWAAPIWDRAVSVVVRAVPVLARAVPRVVVGAVPVLAWAVPRVVVAEAGVGAAGANLAGFPFYWLVHDSPGSRLNGANTLSHLPGISGLQPVHREEPAVRSIFWPRA